jgi:pimeloyl-ACP methyl ester carboxylesterase
MGCTMSHEPSPRKSTPFAEVPRFRYEREELRPRVQRAEEENAFRVQKVAFASSMAPHSVTAYHYVRKSGKTPPTIIILPILAGDYFFSKNCARYLARKGFSCLRFERTANPLEAEKGLAHTEMVFRHAIIDIRRAMDWLDQTGGGNSNRIGIVGISMGAIVAALTLEVEPRISAAAILLGGGDVATILATSRENVVVKFREELMRAHRIGLGHFREEATRILVPIDPLAYAPRMDPRNILMVNARFDKVIPPPCSEKLWEVLGRPPWIRIPTGHYSAALFLPYLRYRILKHFRKVFAERG